jgi:hypothetical protein
VRSIEWKIHRVRADIRYLETEFDARANMRQLEVWNAQDYRYVAPGVGQYLASERSLANLDGVTSNGDPYVAPPVMMAMADEAKDAARPANTSVESPASDQIRADDTIIRAANARAAAPLDQPERPPVKSETQRPSVESAPVRTAAAKPADKSSPTASARLASARPVTADPVVRKAARMALLDAKLLDERTLRDIDARAAAESHGGGAH